jgi:hypothetical protein
MKARGGVQEDQILLLLMFLLLLIFHSMGVSFICLLSDMKWISALTRDIVCPCLHPLPLRGHPNSSANPSIVRRITYGRQSQKSLTSRGRRPPPSESFQHPCTLFLTFLSVCSQAALSDPFSVPNLPRVSPFQPANPAAPPETAPPGPSDEVLSPTVATTATTPESSVSPEQFEAWKAEYESQVVEWRRQSATVRARAEMERARWEERRAHEQTHAGEDVRQRQDTHTSGTSIGTSTSDWEAVSSHRSSTDAPVSTPAPAPPAPPVAPPQVKSSPPVSRPRPRVPLNTN